ncbi:phosphate ABC transporter substrate-binding protein PstS, partial [Thioclava sp. BHET1]
MGAAAAAFSVSLAGVSHAADISGAGSSFIYPVFAKWGEAYKKETGVGLNYQSIGSGGGIKQIIAKTVTFGASDKPLSDEDLDKNGLTQFPMISGGIVMMYNIDGVKPGQLVLDGKTVEEIYMGKITKWNDPAIQALNKDLKLPNEPIVVVHRSDGSGTTFNFTNYLAKISKDWADEIGSDTAVEWPTGLG